MSSQLTDRDREQIHSGIREKYIKVATSPGGQFTYPTGREGLKDLNYYADLTAALPDTVADSYCGVGNPFSLGEIESGSHVLDIGCGAGVDALLAAKLVGDSGKVLGIDLTPEMIQKARSNQKEMSSANIEFQVAGVQDLADMAERFDVVISNGVFNLIPEKEEALQAVFGLLKPGGRVYLADQFLAGRMIKSLQERVASWFQ
jgi:arsenite methyltransferase